MILDNSVLHLAACPVNGHKVRRHSGLVHRKSDARLTDGCRKRLATMHGLGRCVDDNDRGTPPRLFVQLRVIISARS